MDDRTWPRKPNPGRFTVGPSRYAQRSERTDAELALWETCMRFIAYANAAADAGPCPDADTAFVLWDLEMALDAWRERFSAALLRRGIDVNKLMDAAAA